MFYWYTIKNKKALGQLKPTDFMVKTIVTSELIAKIAKANGVECFDEYTGFKWIAYRIRVNEGKRQYIGGGEESFGYLPYDKVRDKDAPASICLICEIAAWAKDQGKTLFDLLLDIYKEYGFQKETTINVVKPGKSGADEIKAMMENFRQNPPQTIAGSKVVTIKDYKVLKRTDNGVVTDFEMPTTSNVLQWFTEDGLKVSVRPSGTEPKIKFYCEVPVPGQFDGDYVAATAKADARVEEIKKDLGL
jgi:phosphoglucomutase